MATHLCATSRLLFLWRSVVPTWIVFFSIFGLGLSLHADAQNYVSGEVLVGIRADKDDAGVPTRLSDVGISIGHLPRIHVHKLKIKDSFSVETAITELSKKADVLFAEPNYIGHLGSTPNDLNYSSQYGPSKVQANLAWDIWRPQQQVVIAIVDSGIDSQHPDLTNVIYRNASDTIIGVNFVPTPPNFNAEDDQYHGTECAGVAGAQTNNSTGMAGIAGWNGQTGTSDTSHIKLMPVKVFDKDGNSDAYKMSNGINWAVANGARVISMSFAIDAGTTCNCLETAVNDAWNAGCVLVASAMNDGSSQSRLPAAYANVISVGATDNSDTLWSLSNYGSTVDLVAPGVSIFTTTFSMPHGSYVTKSGTSYACPHVAGEAALLWAQNPTLSNAQVRSLIEANVDTYTGYTDNSTAPPTVRTIASGGGRINVYRALNATPIPFDFTGPDLGTNARYADILWQHQTTGQLVCWPMTSTAFVSNGIEMYPSLDTNYKIVGQPDLNGDGKPDILFHRPSDGQLVCWLMNGLTRIEPPVIMYQTLDTNYRFVGNGDFNRDGNADLLLQHQTTGQIACWLMDGTTYKSSVIILPSSDTNNKIVGVTDFNRDGKMDILFWYQPTGAVICWVMDGTSYSSSAPVAPSTDTNYRIVGPH